MDPDEDGITPEDDCEEGNPDVGALFVGRDRDGDGIASMEDYHVAPGCEVPQGYSGIFEDCDDTDPDKADVQPWVEDLDGDGAGDDADRRDPVGAVGEDERDPAELLLDQFEQVGGADRFGAMADDPDVATLGLADRPGTGRTRGATLGRRQRPLPTDHSWL